MNISEVIDFHVACILLELKTKFNLQHFRELDSLKDMVAYAKKHLKFLGKGSSRTVFLLSNRYALKIANPEARRRGMAQNRAEVEVYTNPKIRPIVTTIQAADDNYRWIISELSRPLTSEEEFEKLSGISWDTFLEAVWNAKNYEDIIEEEIEEREKIIARIQKRLERADDPQSKRIIQNKINHFLRQIEYFKKLSKNPIIVGTINLINVGGVMPGDIEEWDHWGKTADGRLVLYDYGFTKDVVSLYK